MITVFECPFRADCHEKIVSWVENEPLEIIIPIKCRAPFIVNRNTGQTICMIALEEGKEENWIEAIDEIGRSRKKIDKRQHTNNKKANKRTGNRTKTV